MTGTIKRLVAERGFGFLRDADNREFFFHSSAVEEGAFEQLNVGDEVEFEPQPEAPKGPRARVVKPITPTTALR